MDGLLSGWWQLRLCVWPAHYIVAFVALQELNPLPFAAMSINCAAWLFYAKLLSDW